MTCHRIINFNLLYLLKFIDFVEKSMINLTRFFARKMRALI